MIPGLNPRVVTGPGFETDYSSFGGNLGRSRQKGSTYAAIPVIRMDRQVPDHRTKSRPGRTHGIVDRFAFEVNQADHKGIDGGHQLDCRVLILLFLAQDVIIVGRIEEGQRPAPESVLFILRSVRPDLNSFHPGHLDSSVA